MSILGIRTCSLIRHWRRNIAWVMRVLILRRVPKIFQIFCLWVNVHLFESFSFKLWMNSSVLYEINWQNQDYSHNLLGWSSIDIIDIEIIVLTLDAHSWIRDCSINVLESIMTKIYYFNIEWIMLTINIIEVISIVPSVLLFVWLVSLCVIYHFY